MARKSSSSKECSPRFLIICRVIDEKASGSMSTRTRSFANPTTTITRNLASDLEESLKNLCGSDFARLEVKNLHAWAVAFYERQVGRVSILDDPSKRQELMTQASAETSGEDFDPRFYMDEWEQVVQPQDVTTKEEYFRARRVGRGTRLGRKQRAGVWPVLERYRELLDKEGCVEWQDVVRETRRFIEKQQVELPYRAVLSDEVQDFTANELKLLRALVPAGPNDLFVVGDAHQRIYGQMTRLGACGIEIRGRSRRLKLNYRTTEEIRNHAVAVLEGLEIDDLDGGIDSVKGYRSLRNGPKPQLLHQKRAEDEERVIVETLRGWLETTPAEEICLAARTNKAVEDRYAKILAQADIPRVLVMRSTSAEKGGIRLATMHRLKGLEFSKVILAGVHKGEVPKLYAGMALADEASREDAEKQERCLFYVASTRARDELVITGYGDQSPFLATGASS